MTTMYACPACRKAHDASGFFIDPCHEGVAEGSSGKDKFWFSGELRCNESGRTGYGLRAWGAGSTWEPGRGQVLAASGDYSAWDEGNKWAEKRKRGYQPVPVDPSMEASRVRYILNQSKFPIAGRDEDALEVEASAPQPSAPVDIAALTADVPLTELNMTTALFLQATRDDTQDVAALMVKRAMLTKAVTALEDKATECRQHFDEADKLLAERIAKELS